MLIEYKRCKVSHPQPTFSHKASRKYKSQNTTNAGTKKLTTIPYVQRDSSQGTLAWLTMHNHQLYRLHEDITEENLHGHHGACRTCARPIHVRNAQKSRKRRTLLEPRKEHLDKKLHQASWRMNVFLLHPKQVRKFLLISPFLLSTVTTRQGSMAGKRTKDLQMRQAQT